MADDKVRWRLDEPLRSQYRNRTAVIEFRGSGKTEKAGPFVIDADGCFDASATETVPIYPFARRVLPKKR